MVNAYGSIRKLIASFAVKFCRETAGVANLAGGCEIFKSITFSPEADWATIQRTI